jgi:thioesterase domain-containing protein
MNLASFLADLKTRGVVLKTDGERLICNAPNGVLTAEQRGALRQQKGDIIRFLQLADSLDKTPQAVVPLQPKGELNPIFAIPGHNGDVFCYRHLAKRLGEDQPFFGLQPPGLDDGSLPLNSIRDLAHYFLEQILALGYKRPHVIAGFCAGGSCALELARLLQMRGIEINFVALFACPYPAVFRYIDAVYLAESLIKHGKIIITFSWLRNPRQYFSNRFNSIRSSLANRHHQPTDPIISRRIRVEQATMAAARNHRPTPFSGRLGLFLPEEKWKNSRFAPLRWKRFASQTDLFYGPDGVKMDEILLEPAVGVIAERFKSYQKLIR